MLAPGRLARLIAVGWLALSAAQYRFLGSSQAPISLTTRDRLEDTAWWPTKGTPAA